MQMSLEGRYADVVEASPQLFPVIHNLFVNNGVTLTNTLEGEFLVLDEKFFWLISISGPVVTFLLMSNLCNSKR
jgi:hypothetical protein